MSTFLFVMVEGGGNVPAQLAVARRLAARGHGVHVLADRAVEPDAVRAGCRFQAFQRAPRHHMRDRHADILRDWEPSSPIAQLRRSGDHLMFGPAKAYAHDVLDAIGRIHPDAVAVDCLPMGAIVGAEKSGVPSALIFHTPYMAPVEGISPFGLGLQPATTPLGRLRDRLIVSAMKRLFRFGLAPLNDARRGVGLEPLREVFDQYQRLTRSLILTSREYDFVPSGLPAQACYVGPQLDDPAWPDPWTPPWPADAGDPLVVVSLGSTYQRQERTFDAIVAALGTLPVRALATLGSIDPRGAPPPSNVVVVRSAPHASVLPLASALVCHGGHGTVMKALAHGLPVLVLPLGRDQKDNGARVVAAGAGLVLPAGASEARIAAAVRRVLEEPRFREGARRMAAIIARDVAQDRAVAEMEQLARAPRAAAPRPSPRSDGDGRIMGHAMP